MEQQLGAWEGAILVCKNDISKLEDLILEKKCLIKKVQCLDDRLIEFNHMRDRDIYAIDAVTNNVRAISSICVDMDRAISGWKYRHARASINTMIDNIECTIRSLENKIDAKYNEIAAYQQKINNLKFEMSKKEEKKWF